MIMWEPIYAGADPCDACGAGASEPCRPYCVGAAAHADTVAERVFSASRAARNAFLVVVAAVVGAVFLSAPAAGSGPPEDSPSWDCRVDGNRVCGAGNDQGVPPGLYWDCGADLCHADEIPPDRALWSGAVFPAVSVARLGGR